MSDELLRDGSAPSGASTQGGKPSPSGLERGRRGRVVAPYILTLAVRSCSRRWRASVRERRMAERLGDVVPFLRADLDGRSDSVGATKSLLDGHGSSAPYRRGEKRLHNRTRRGRQADGRRRPGAQAMRATKSRRGLGSIGPSGSHREHAGEPICRRRQQTLGDRLTEGPW